MRHTGAANPARPATARRLSLPSMRMKQLTQLRLKATWVGWVGVCLPLAWGIYQTTLKAMALFH